MSSRRRIEELFSESRSDDLLLLHFSGHGLKSESGELFFAAIQYPAEQARVDGSLGGFRAAVHAG